MSEQNITAVQEELEFLRQHNHYCVLDIECTGLSPKKGGRIIEIAAVRVINGEIQEERFECLVNPQLKIPKKITELTGITNEDVKNQPTIFQVLPEFYRFIGDAVIVGHNVAFDWDRFLLDGFRQVGIFPTNPTFCTFKFFKKLYPNRGRNGYRLNEMCDLLGIPLENHHRAIDDTISTAKCLIHFIQEFVPEALTQPMPVIPKEVNIEHTPVQVKRVSYWEKRKNKKEMFRRQYVQLSTGKVWGTVYFDIPTQTWGNKDFSLPIDFRQIEKDVLQFLGLKTRIDLINFRN